MKRYIYILLFTPLLGFGQMGIYDNRLTILPSGEILYTPIHAVGSADSINVTIANVDNVYRGIKGTGITWREEDGITGTADSFKVLTAGDYEVTIYIGLYTSQANDILRLKLYKNNTPSATSIGRFTLRVGATSATTTEIKNYKWYITCAANDRVSFRITNQTGNRNISITDYKLLIKKMPE